MRLRRQLLLLSLLLLSLPWAGCQYVREMEGALQSGQEQSLLATTQALATVLRDSFREKNQGSLNGMYRSGCSPRKTHSVVVPHLLKPGTRKSRCTDCSVMIES